MLNGDSSSAYSHSQFNTIVEAGLYTLDQKTNARLIFLWYMVNA